MPFKRKTAWTNRPRLRSYHFCTLFECSNMPIILQTFQLSTCFLLKIFSQYPRLTTMRRMCVCAFVRLYWTPLSPFHADFHENRWKLFRLLIRLYFKCFIFSERKFHSHQNIATVYSSSFCCCAWCVTICDYSEYSFADCPVSQQFPYFYASLWVALCSFSSYAVLDNFYFLFFPIYVLLCLWIVDV